MTTGVSWRSLWPTTVFLATVQVGFQDLLYYEDDTVNEPLVAGLVPSEGTDYSV